MVTFETQEDFEAAVKRYLEGNLRVRADRTSFLVSNFNNRVGVVDIYLTLEDPENVFTST